MVSWWGAVEVYLEEARGSIVSRLTERRREDTCVVQGDTDLSAEWGRQLLRVVACSCCKAMLPPM